MRWHLLMKGALAAGAALLALFSPTVVALDNGFVTPALGWSSW